MTRAALALAFAACAALVILSAVAIFQWTGLTGTRPNGGSAGMGALSLFFWAWITTAIIRQLQTRG